jgi:hypothetical protein
MADSSDAPAMQNPDVIQSARAIRANPTLMAALCLPDCGPGNR